MAGRPSKLNAEVHQEIVAYTRAGSFAWVAAVAAGVSKTTFYRWMQKGDSETRGPYFDFANDVRQAQAQARVAAETEVRRTSPATWLRFGPGRDRPDEPGWTDQRQITGPDAGPVLKEIDDDALRAILRRLITD